MACFPACFLLILPPLHFAPEILKSPQSWAGKPYGSSDTWSPRDTHLCPRRSHPHDLPLGSDLSHSIVTVISGEEHFEDYGEGNEADLFSDSLCNGESSFSSSSFLSPR